MDKLLCLMLEPLDQRVELQLNGVVVGSVPAGSPYSRPIHEFVRAGENRLCITVPSNHQHRLGRPLELNCRLVLNKHRGDQHWVEPEVLYEFTTNRAMGERLDRQRALDVAFDLPVRFPVWDFLNVPPPLVLDNLQDRLEDFLFRWIAAWDARDLDFLLPRYTRRNRELSLAYGQDHSSQQHQFGVHLQTLMSTHALDDAAREPTQWVFQSQRKSALHRVCNAQGDDLLRFVSTAGDGTWVWPHHLAVLPDDVYILR
ncbi:hypothetical protein NQT62_03275 [Limnobacter humi]|uniref:Uncharacterized protein n=1 Tax=Limnobacter humi TaxID=1778671 RepID=A0ABT1WD90_9BURK|nr:hypothetical protein [Limnobacter humi]MCQ8895460.1 hypothetical protein [Limnobacter humi]